MKRLFIIPFILSLQAKSQNFISEKREPGSFPIAIGNSITPIYADTSDDWLVQKAAVFLQHDIEMVTGKKSAILTSLLPSSKNIIIIGTYQKSPIIDRLKQEKKMDLEALRNKWESFQIQVVPHPFQGTQNALVIVGSDKRGTAYGVFELSKQMGVSPWYWWADVPVKKKRALYVKGGHYQFGPPGVKYRGIFINDEAPAFSGWTKEKFGGVNHQVYEKVFELILRLKGNYLWPAMWGNAFNDDDSLNPILADKYGIVMGTSHHEPMMRAQQEWKRYGHGAWNYQTNDSVLRSFWRKGIENMGSRESIITIGMRGDGDMPMTQGSNIALLEKIVKDQRDIIQEVTRKDVSQTPQLWALYKEVQDYYDKGMRVPDDVTLLLCDDNWGNIRKLPKWEDKKHAGGYGIYYHFDYVGGPRNYKWINTNQIERTWEQMHLAYEYGADKIWIVNVGDLKPMELPISFFLDYAWNPNQWRAEELPTYYNRWAEQQFGKPYAKPIGAMLAKYTKYNSRRKPELLSPDTYSLTDYNEADQVVTEYNQLLSEANKVNNLLPAAYKDAFYELVLHPVQASANLNELYVTVAKNRWYAKQGLIRANYFAEKAIQLYTRDSLISNYYNDTLAGGKWHHMMDQTHIGYTYWQQPIKNKMPEVLYVRPDSATKGKNINVPGPVAERLKGKAYHYLPKIQKLHAFVETSGYISIEAEHYSKAITTPSIKWMVIPNLGRGISSVESYPPSAHRQSLSAGSPHLEYNIYVTDSGTVKVKAFFSPTLNFHNEGSGLEYAISIDNEAPQIISINNDDNNVKTWEGWVANNIIIKTSGHALGKPGKHVLKFWLVDSAVVLQKLVVDMGGLKPSYLGPPETKVR